MKKNLIQELNPKEKTPLGKGRHHVVYPNLRDPSKVFKTPKEGFPKINYKWVKMFEEHPDMFPKVYRVSDRYVSLEKLDTNKAITEYQLLDGLLKKDDELYSGDFAYTLYRVYVYDDKDLEREIDNYFDNMNIGVATIYKRWKKLIFDFFNLMPEGYNSDLHQDQFGYSKEGKLKILDF